MGNSKKHIPFKRVMDELEQKHLHFDGTGYEEYHDYADGSEQEQAVRTYQADPYQIVVENTLSDTPLTARLFGRDKYLLATNFGNPTGIKISLGQPGVDYVELLQQSASKPFSTQFMRIESENKLQITKFITVTEKDANGNMFRRPMNMQQYKSAYQQQENMLDVPINEYVDGSTLWEFVLDPDTKVFLTIFPLYKVDTASTLKGRDPIKSYAQARVNTAGIQLLPAQGHQLKR